MPSKPPADAIPPIEPAPAKPPVPVVAPPVPDVAPPAAAPLAPVTPADQPRVDPYGGQPSYPPSPGSYPPGYYPPGYYAPAVAPRGLAIAAMVCGIVGAFFGLFEGLGLFPAIAGVILGHLAIKRNPTARGMALAGLICGYVGILISLVWIAFLVIFLVVGLSTVGNIDG